MRSARNVRRVTGTTSRCGGRRGNGSDQKRAMGDEQRRGTERGRHRRGAVEWNDRLGDRRAEAGRGDEIGLHLHGGHGHAERRDAKHSRASRPVLPGHGTGRPVVWRVARLVVTALGKGRRSGAVACVTRGVQPVAGGSPRRGLRAGGSRYRAGGFPDRDELADARARRHEHLRQDQEQHQRPEHQVPAGSRFASPCESYRPIRGTVNRNLLPQTGIDTISTARELSAASPQGQC